MCGESRSSLAWHCAPNVRTSSVVRTRVLLLSYVHYVPVVFCVVIRSCTILVRNFYNSNFIYDEVRSIYTSVCDTPLYTIQIWQYSSSPLNTLPHTKIWYLNFSLTWKSYKNRCKNIRWICWKYNFLQQERSSEAFPHKSESLLKKSTRKIT